MTATKIQKPRVSLGIKEHVGDSVLGAGVDLEFEILEPALLVRKLRIDRGADAKVGFLRAVGGGPARTWQIFAMVEFADLFDQLVCIAVAAFARLPLGLSIRWISTQGQDVS